MSLLQGRRGLVVGIANHRSLAYGIARAARREGAELVLTFQDERLEGRVRELGVELGARRVVRCDLTLEHELTALADAVYAEWGALDFVVHSVAYADRDELSGRFLDTSREGFAAALDVSVYSLVALVRALEPLLVAGAGARSVLTLSYLGGERVVPGYNVMGVAKAALEAAVRYLAVDLGPRGVRVNALSPGPVKTLSAAGLRELRAMLAHVAEQAPLERNVDLDDIGDAALSLLSELGRAVTGEVVYVDGGYHVLGAPRAKGGEP